MAWPFSSISTSLVDSSAGEGDGFEEGCGDGSVGSIGFECVDVICFTLFDSVASFLCKLPSAFLFLIRDILSLSDDTHSELVCACSPTETFQR